MLKDYKRPYDKINELVKQQILLPVKRGIYLPGPALNMDTPEPFLLANHLLGPSYVSLDAALSYWGLIPEKVFAITSVTTQTSKVYKTTVGKFSYTHLPLPYYAFGIKLVELTKKQTAMVATPEKALCDKIVTTAGILLRSPKQAMELLLDDLRMDEQLLRNLNVKEMNTWLVDSPKKNSLTVVIKALQQL